METQNFIAASGVPAYLHTDGRPLDQHDVAAMDADGDKGWPGVEIIRDDVDGVLDQGADKTVTYASVTAKSTQHGSSKKTAAAKDEEIVILEEDSTPGAKSKPSGRTVVDVSPSKNAAYLESNPERKGKSRTGDPLSVKVVPTLGGNAANVVVHAPRRATGNHAVVITEPGILSAGTANAKERRARNVGVKMVLGTTGRISKGLKSSEAHISNTRGVSKFIEDLTDRLDTIPDTIMPNPSVSVMETDKGDGGIGDTEVSSPDTDSQYNEDYGDEILPVEQ
ncbi:hypothetical protein V6N12_051190 [Hibiscus sabdariffa]|uniref:Uncharacterized protein n=1 Tax=Hibiscus sabdariffa TaxID=183260 RepID=A0ABR2GEQ6_9ROSI